MSTVFETEWRKMLEGEIYDAGSREFDDRLQQTREKLWSLNSMNPAEREAKERVIRSLLGSCGKRVHFNTPFRCDYGCNIHVGENFFANFNFTVLDEAPVRIGDNVMIGPNVSIYTACHPIEAEARNTLVQWAEPVTIGSDVWICGSVTVLSGVTIGDRCVIGAGSVVTRDIPADSLAAGNPAKVIRKLDSGEIMLSPGSES